MFRLNGEWRDCPNDPSLEHYVGYDSYGYPHCYSCAADDQATRLHAEHEQELRAKHGDSWQDVAGTEKE